MVRCGQAGARIRFARGSLYERVGKSNILSCFLVGRPRPEYGLPVAVIKKKVKDDWIHGRKNFKDRRRGHPDAGGGGGI